MDEELFGQEPDLEDVIEAFMKGNADEETLSDDDERDTEADDASEEDTDAEEAEGSETDPEGADDEATEEDSDAPAKAVAGDDAEVLVTVDGKELRVSVKDLKRLYGQEASLTQKSQAIADQRRVVEAQGLYLAKILQDRYVAAQAKVAKYKDVDLFRASRELDPEDFDALRAAKEGAESELAALEREGAEFVQRATQVRQDLLRTQAKESLKAITQAIPEWSDELYGKIRTYAVSQGMDADIVNEVVDPGAILMMHKAMKYDESQVKKATVTKKVTKAPTKVLKSSTNPNREPSKLKTLRREATMSGDIDDVADLFLAASKN
jgi:hypothetical protein